MKEIFNILKIKKEERLLTIVALSLLAVLHTMNILVRWDLFTAICDDYKKMALKSFRFSGFDPFTYVGITEWDTVYNIYRHPLLAFFICPLSMINKGVIMLTGFNAAILLASLVVIFCALYSAIFLYRIMRELIGLQRWESNILVLLTFSFAYIMLAAVAPDHFIMSMFAITLTLYIAGDKMKRGSTINMWQTICLFLFTAGVTLSNGLKVFIASLFSRKKKFFEWKYLLSSVLLPSALLWGLASWEYSTFEVPKKKIHAEERKKLNDKYICEIRAAVTDTIQIKDSALIEKEIKKEVRRRAIAKKKRDDMRAVILHSGKPIAKEGFLEWTDITTSRWDAMMDNLFGEGIQLHEDYLLGDVLENRPVIVKYTHWYNYMVEGIILLLFLAGIWRGREKRLLWLSLSFVLIDMAIHLGLGFGINEIFIMSAHFLFVIPVSIGFLLSSMKKGKFRNYVAAGVLFTAIWCLTWNISLLVKYLLFIYQS